MEALAANTAALREKKQEAKRLGVAINRLTKQINAGGGGGAGGDASQAALVRELKAEYRDLFNQRKFTLSEAEYAEQLVKQCQQELVEGFEAHARRGAAAP